MLVFVGCQSVGVFAHSRCLHSYDTYFLFVLLVIGVFAHSRLCLCDTDFMCWCLLVVSLLVVCSLSFSSFVRCLLFVRVACCWRVHPLSLSLLCDNEFMCCCLLAISLLVVCSLSLSSLPRCLLHVLLFVLLVVGVFTHSLCLRLCDKSSCVVVC